MEGKEASQATTSSGLDGERGAGGKFRKPTARKPPTTPYDRPASRSQDGERRDGGWLSKLVDPASRLLSGGASRLLPSFFSKAYSLASPSSDSGNPEMKQDACDKDSKKKSDVETPRVSSEGPSKVMYGSKHGSDVEEPAGETLGKRTDVSGISEIEQLMKGRTLSRDEFNRLTKILTSRVADTSNADQSMKERAEAVRVTLAQENIATPVKEKQEYLDRVKGITFNSLPQSNIRDDIGPSPVDIAKAYMGSRTSELGLGSENIKLNNERSLQYTDDFSSQSVSSSPPKLSTCWPGVLVQDSRGYLTPQTQRARIGLHNLPRTPYSRTVYPKSTSKLHGGSSRSTHWKQSETPIYGTRQAMKSRSDILDSGFGSVGPIRRTHHKYISETPSRGAALSHADQPGPSWKENTDASKSFLPAVKKNLEPNAATSDTPWQHKQSKPLSVSTVVPTVHPQSTEIARKILEHLDRTVPTPKEKSAELKLATTLKKPLSSELTTVTPNAKFSGPHLGVIDSYQNRNLVRQKLFTQENEDSGSCLLNSHSQLRKNCEDMDAPNSNPLESNVVRGLSGSKCDDMGVKERLLMDSKEAHESQKNAHQVSEKLSNGRQSETNEPFSLRNQINGQDVSTTVHGACDVSRVLVKPPTHSSGSRPPLTSISITKSGHKHMTSFDNGSAFTFPMPASSGLLPEPPTPSVLPISSASGVAQSKVDSPVPSFTFGSKKSSPPLVFNFPSTSTSNHDDDSMPKFNFGSDKKTRVTFRSVGKDAICY